MWMLDTPSPFAPTNEMLAFLKECEEIKDHDPYGQVQRAMAEVRGSSGRSSPKGGELGVDDNRAVFVGPQEQIGGIPQVDGDEPRQGRPRRKARGGAGPEISSRGGHRWLKLNNNYVASH